MNKNLFDVISKNLQQIFDEENINVVVTQETELDRSTGIDSLGFLKLVFGIEEDLEINLDDYLEDVRKARTVNDLVAIIEKVLEK